MIAYLLFERKENAHKNSITGLKFFNPKFTAALNMVKAALNMAGKKFPRFPCAVII
jgi:hypothetical protein